MGHCNEYAAHALNIAACLHLAHTERYADAESLFLKIYRIRLRTGLFPAAARSLNQAVYCLALQGQMHAVMTKLVWLGQLYYSELRDHRKAQSTFEKAAVLSEEQKQPRLAEMLWVLIAEIAASYSKDYEKAAICFERAARQNMQSLPIHRHPRANMFKAGLCHLLDRGHGSWRLRLLLDLGFFEIDSTFPGGLEWNILQSIFEALQKRDRGTVDPIVAECKQLSEVDCFAAALLEQI
ncbi:TPR-like protein [Viridothelium virens]|uniref:TPR-like protein n=1 Tax=Viridothelium virens TaxID=1048519 RepID=A0A6A6HEK3_VIRVR|nr:TPR-like protein [Viridothelium virens]